MIAEKRKLFFFLHACICTYVQYLATHSAGAVPNSSPVRAMYGFGVCKQVSFWFLNEGKNGML